jgi:hypothetical protein
MYLSSLHYHTLNHAWYHLCINEYNDLLYYKILILALDFAVLNPRVYRREAIFDMITPGIVERTVQPMASQPIFLCQSIIY